MKSSILALISGVTLSGNVAAQQFIDDPRNDDPRAHAFEESLGRYFESVDRKRVKTPFEKVHRNTLSEYAPVIESARASVVKVIKGDQVKALGTVVAKEGLIITKASEIEDDNELAVELPGESERIVAELIEVNEENDLALLWVHDFSLTPVTWAPGTELPVGTSVVTAGRLGFPLAVGSVSLPIRNLLESSKGFLGVQMQPADDGSGLVVLATVNGHGAEKAGMLRGDVIQAIDGDPMRTSHDLINNISESEPGDTVVVQILRDGEELMLEVELGEKDAGMGYNMPMHEQLDKTARMGGRVSRKRSGFPAAIQHDMLLRPTQCGSPLVNLDGDVVGVNIARASRVKSYAIPSDVIQEWLGDPQILAVEVLERRVKNAKSARKAAEEALEAAKATEFDVEEALQQLRQQRIDAENALEANAGPAPEVENAVEIVPAQPVRRPADTDEAGEETEL